jgi:hypothetical protein
MIGLDFGAAPMGALQEGLPKTAGAVQLCYTSSKYNDLDNLIRRGGDHFALLRLASSSIRSGCGGYPIQMRGG